MSKNFLTVFAAGLMPKVNNLARSTVPSNRGFFGVMGDIFAGSWQSHVQLDNQQSILAFSAVYKCVTGIASDIAKLWVDLVERDGEIYRKVSENSPFWTVLRRPNSYQTWYKFIEQWIISKLLHGNAYILKRRDLKRIVMEMYVLDPIRVKPLVTPAGDVYYELSADYLSGIKETVTVPASEIIHDMMCSLWHPLVGISPLYACAMSATMGNRIQSNSTKFFTNSSRPSGILVTPGAITAEAAQEMKQRWEENYSGENSGRTAVLGNGLKYESISQTAEAAQLIEQLRWSVEDVARAFGFPMYKLGGAVPAGSSIESLNQGYYSDCLQPFVESAEQLLDQGLGLRDKGYHAVFNLENLLRMDRKAQMESLEIGTRASIYAPNEARAYLNLPPVDGGESPMAQQQNYSLAALAKRDAQEDPFSTTAPEPDVPEPPENDDDMEAEELLAYIRKGLH